MPFEALSPVASLALSGAPSAGATDTVALTSVVPLADVPAMFQRVPDEIRRVLGALDEQLIGVLRRLAVRLVSSEWVLAQPADFRMLRRQDLEAIERSGTGAPLLSAADAVALIERGDRSVGALTYGWLTPCDPDPLGARIEVLRAALIQLPHIKAFFGDFASLPQWPRSLEDDELFGEALSVMGDLYASAIGTTVLQLKEIPDSPAHLPLSRDLCLFGLCDGVDELTILGAFRDAEVRDICGDRATIRFASREAAVAAKDSGAPISICVAVDFLYNSRAYDDRGWCCFEDAVSDEMLARLNKKMREALSVLPAKKLLLERDQAPVQSPDAAQWVDNRFETIRGRINSARFTGSGDKEIVVGLYRGYAERIVAALQQGLIATPQEQERVQELAPLPTVDVHPPGPLLYTPGQLVLLQDRSLGVVDSTVARVERALVGGFVHLSFDACLQTVLPWRPLEQGWDEALRRDIERLRGMERLDVSTLQPPYESSLHALREAVERAVGSALQMTTIEGKVTEASDRARDAIQSAISQAKIGTPEITAQQLTAVHDTCAQLQPEALEGFLAGELKRSGGVGARRYGVSQQLTVHHLDEWRDAEVTDAATVQFGSGELVPFAPHPWNHAPREMLKDSFERVRAWHLESLRRGHSHIVDALSGRRLDALQQCVAIDVVGKANGITAEAGVSSVADAHALATQLSQMHQMRRGGLAAEGPAAVLLTAGPAAGKTTLLSQLVVLSLAGELVPILVKVQLLQRRLIAWPRVFEASWNWVDAFLSLELGDGAHYRMLRQAMASRRALLLLDGLDEGGASRVQIERHVAEVLAPQGHVLLATSRPAGVQQQLFAQFIRLGLSPLTEDQQRQVIEQRLGDSGAAQLLAYVGERLPLDTDTGERVTSNPLMLSMVMSVFELRRDLGMPSTVTGLYAVASDAMLARGGSDGPRVRRLLQAIFFEAHAAQRRLIEDWQLDEAALALDLPNKLEEIRRRSAVQVINYVADLREACCQLPESARAALSEVRERVSHDQLPLLSLLQVDPLQVQSSHLSFQEYFAARAICESGTNLSGPPPWKWPVWWANAVKIGGEMGDAFGKGLMRAAGVEGTSLDLKGKLGGHGPTVLAVLEVLSASVTKISLAQNMLGEEGTKTICEAVGGNKVLKELDLSGSSSTSNIGGAAGAKHVGAMLRVTTSVTSVRAAVGW